MSTNDIVYDPTEIQIRELDKMLDTENISISNLVKNPQAVQLILRQQTVLLHELKYHKGELGKSNTANDTLRDERESLRISVAQLQERQNVSIIEIPISIASGFAINMLTSNSKDLVGWMLLIITFLLLLFLRQVQIFSFFTKFRTKEEKK